MSFWGREGEAFDGCGIMCAFSTFVTCDEILGCLVCFFTYIPFYWVQNLNCVEHGNELWPRAILGGGLGGGEGAI